MADLKPLPVEPISVTGIHLYKDSGRVIVCAEIDGRWVEVIRENVDAPFSHIVEPAGMRRCANAAENATNYTAG